MRIRVLQLESESTLLVSDRVRSGMNYGRGSPLPHYEKSNSWTPATGIPPENGIGPRRGSWTAAMLGGPIPGVGGLGETHGIVNPVDDEVICGKESESWMTIPRGNGIMGHRDLLPTIHQKNGIVTNGQNWNPVIPGGSSWTPVTPGKPISQRSNLITVNKPTNQIEQNENWRDLVGMYKDLLREETLNLNEVAQEIYPIQNNGNQTQIRVEQRNMIPILNSTPIPNPNQNHDSNPVSYFPYEDRNWDNNLLSAIVRPKKSSENIPFINTPQNNGVHDLNIIPVSDSTTHVQSNFLLKNQQSPTFNLDMINGYNSKQLHSDGFPVPYRASYNLNSPPRSELDAASGVTGPLPFAPITPDTGRKQIENQWVPVNTTRESQSQSQSRSQSQRNENTDNHDSELLHNIVESTSSAVSTTQKDPLLFEEGGELGIDLNKTPNQKTPARRKKHRPKVIREAKPKKTKTPKDPTETPVKRKYVRKKDVDVLESPQGNEVRVKRKYVRKKGVESKKTDVEEVTGPVVKTPVKSVKKKLNFDLEESQMREGEHGGGINLNVNPQDIEQERGINNVLERSAMKVAQNNVNDPAIHMAKARDHALNVLARNLTMKNGYNNQVGQTVNLDERRGIKRQFFEQVNPRILNAMDSLVMYQKLLLGGDVRVDRGQDLASINYLESHKKTKTQNDGFAPEDNSRAYPSVPALQLLNSCSQRVVNPPYHTMNGGGGNLTGGHFRPSVAAVTQNLQKHPEASGITQRSIQEGRVNPVTAMVSWNRPPATPPKDPLRSGVVTYPGTMIDKKNTTPKSSNQIQRSNLEVHQQSTKPKGGRKPKVSVVVSVEDVTGMLEGLCIYDENEKMRNAIVPFRGSNVIVPFEPIKKRKPRPKVDLDPESDRLWRLLMGKEGSEANETMDKDKEKWWENERRVFRGRADSFIARMHLVQGDRRFSRWKGSVVDSVIGVFLTQNVSDHLSSSAFMSLAAKFPFKTSTDCQNGTRILVEEPIESIVEKHNRTSESGERSKDAKDSLDYEALRRAHVNQISDAIRERGMNNLLADRIKDFLDRLVRDHGSIDLEWLRDVPPDKAKDYLLSIRGLGLKSVECVRLLTLHHLAFPVDTNVGRIAVRLGWVPLQPLPESLQLHLLEMYPVLESIQKYLWPRLCKLDQLTLYELHYQMITFGKVFCTKSKPNCNACPMRAECRHFASAFASARLALPGPEEKKIVPSVPNATESNPIPPLFTRPMSLPPSENNYTSNTQSFGRQCEPIIEEPTTPEPETAELSLSDIEDQYYDDDGDGDEIPTIKLDMNEFTMNLQKMQESMDIQGDMSKALVALNPQAASIPTPKLKNVSRLRTEHQVYELPDSHPILKGLDRREPDDPSPYLLAIWTPGETANSMQPPERGCQAQETGVLCDRTTCFSCNCIKEANAQRVRGTILMPCRTATRGSFPLNGTYFQVNEMFADHASSLNPIDVPRAWIWNLPRRTVYFGTSVSTIFKGLTTQEIQQCFWRGFVCVRGFDQKTRAPRPLMARLHFPASRLVNKKNEDK
ncbi:unnamed protein product [Lactuca saligna]|uniref:HhH-GPD domain-containing protein n=1 Tax=Lactuca saligna TaxID=75948 RepID=A0AA36A092_LACSI|nr:unnamed protein product [Lactuca saligna]